MFIKVGNFMVNPAHVVYLESEVDELDGGYWLVMSDTRRIVVKEHEIKALLSEFNSLR